MRLLPARSVRTRFSINQRGISTEDAVGLIVNGYAKEVLNKLPGVCGEAQVVCYFVGRQRQGDYY